jgi:hypothetical protein
MFGKPKNTMHVAIKRLYFTTAKQFLSLLVDCVNFSKDERLYLKHCIQDGAESFELYVAPKELAKLRKLGKKRKAVKIRRYSWQDKPSGVRDRGLRS